MSKLLVVKGHPLTADYSLSLKGLDAFVKAYKAAHPEDEIEELDVFSADIPTLNTSWGKVIGFVIGQLKY